MKSIVLLCLLLAVGSYAAPAFFAPFGPANGDTVLYPDDDGYSGSIAFDFRFFGVDETNLYVDNNGLLSFSGPVSQYSPQGLATINFPSIAPYWADVDTRATLPSGNTVNYRSTTDANVLNTQSNLVVNQLGVTGFVATRAFIVTWDRVGFYLEDNSKQDTFQVILLADDNDNSFVLFNYGILQWTTGDASGGSGGLGGIPAFAGFTAADGNSAHVAQLPGSGTSAALNWQSTSNVGLPGEWMFRVNEGVIIVPCCDSNNQQPTLAGVPSSVNLVCGQSLPNPGTVTATVGCPTGSAPFPVTPSTSVSGQCPAASTVTRTWTVTDDCGRTVTQRQTISFSPNVLTLSVAADASSDCAHLIDSSTDSPVASGNCPLGVNTPYLSSTVPSSGSCAYDYTVARTWSVSDNCGSTATATRHISYSDTVAPTVVAPADVTFQCGTSFSTAISSTGDASISDNCDPSPQETTNDVNTQSLCFNGIGSIARTFTGTDVCGNHASATQHITIEDTTAPSITASSSCIFPPNGAIHCYSASDLITSYSDICSTVNLGQGNCQPSLGCNIVNGQYCIQAVLGTYSIPFTATDACGNSASATASVDVPIQNDNCAVFTSCDSAISGVSPSQAVFTTIDAYGYEYAPQYRAAVVITVAETLLSNWRLEIHFPAGDELVRYGTYYDVYTDGMFKCESSDMSVAVISPQSWANPISQGNIITVEYVATNNGRLTAAQIQANTVFYVFTAN
jgi:hypothetical protein